MDILGSVLTTLLEEFMSANGNDIIALTGRAHCHGQVAIFFYLGEAKSCRTRGGLSSSVVVQ